MPTNIEIKARLRDFRAAVEAAEAVSDTPVERIHQEDRFFNSPTGRLKLRILGPEDGQLIYYTRPDAAGPKASRYEISRTREPESLSSVLAQALGLRGVVRKLRRLYLAGQTRIHLDEVEGLGAFLELEVVLRPGQPEQEGAAIAAGLMAQLGVRQDDLIEAAYIDLQEQASGEA